MNWLCNTAVFSNQPAILTDVGCSISYLEMERLSSELVESVTEKDLVVLECDNSVFSVLAYVGLVGKRVPTLLVDRNLADDLKSDLFAHYHVSVVIGNGDLKRLSPSGPAMHSDLALLLSTSGSTGSPKLVRLTNSNLHANARQISTYLHLDDKSRAITSLPQQYSFGLSIINSHFLVGGSIVLTNRSVAERAFWELFEVTNANSLSGVPATFEMLRRIRFERMVLPSLKTLAQAGGRLQAELVEFFSKLGQAKGFDFYVMYGQTEATARMAYLPPSFSISRSESIGFAIPEGKFELIDTNGSLIQQPGVQGELVYQGPNVMLGYATNIGDLQKGDELGGVLRTGDIAERDSEGFYYIRGRIKRFVKLFGNRVNLDEVEKHLQSKSISVYISGRDDLVVIFGLDQDSVQAGLAEFCKQFKFHHSGVKACVVDAIPRNESGKLQYNRLMEVFQNQMGGSK